MDDSKKNYGFKSAQNESAIDASVPEEWRGGFQPLPQKKSEFEIPYWLAAVVLAVLVGAIVVLACKGQVNGIFGEALGAIIAWTALIALFLLSLLIYFLPSIAANRRRHRNRAAIFVCNLVFGWTFLGWGIAMVWACTKNVEG